MLSVGVDIIELHRIERAMVRWGDRLLRRVFTEREVRYCRGRIPELAARFAAKEAISKALGTGLAGISWREMEILPNHRGKPCVILHGRAQERAARLGLREWAVSLSHSDHHAVASVVAADR